MKKFFCVSLVAALSLLLFSCNGINDSELTGKSAEKARVSFSVKDFEARTVMPTNFTPEDISFIELVA